MKEISIIAVIFMLSCSFKKEGHLEINSETPTETLNNSEMEITPEETEILNQFDLAFNGIPSKYYPTGKPGDIKYNFFLDLESGYCIVAGSRIHVYADSTRWAVVFESSGYQTRQSAATIDLIYIGNCINYPVAEYPERNYITNTRQVILISSEELERIRNKDGSIYETFESIDPNVEEVKIRNVPVKFEGDYKLYQAAGIEISDYENPNKLIGFGDFVRFLHEKNLELILANEDDICNHIPKDITKLLTIDEFHFSSIYEKTNPPSHQETFKLIAKIITTLDTSIWKPTQVSNNSWKNWMSGHL